MAQKPRIRQNSRSRLWNIVAASGPTDMTTHDQGPHPSPWTLRIAIAMSTIAILGCDALGDADPRDGAGVAALPGDSDATDTDTDGAGGCTLTQGYWKNHQPWPLVDPGLCGQSWDDILHTPPKGDAWYILAHQWIAASLNVAAGAAVTPEVQAALDVAAGYLEDCSIDAGEKADALAYSGLLDDYNNGAIGPGHCGDGDSGDDGGDTTAGDDTGDATDGDDTGDDTGATTGPSWPVPG
jgi:hypothetical protein